MINLLMETSTERALVSVAEGQHVLAQKSLPTGYDHSKQLLPAIQSLLGDLGIGLSQLSVVTTGVGPGSYTGIRVAVIVAKSLSLALSIPLIGVPSLSCFIPGEWLPTGDGRFAALIDAKIGGIYALFGENHDGQVIYQTPPALLSISEVDQALQEISIIVTPNAIPLHRRLGQGAVDRWVWQERGPDAHQMAKLADQSYRDGRYSKDHQVEILYLRPTQAEIEIKTGRNRTASPGNGEEGAFIYYL